MADYLVSVSVYFKPARGVQDAFGMSWTRNFKISGESFSEIGIKMDQVQYVIEQIAEPDDGA